MPQTKKAVTVLDRSTKAFTKVIGDLQKQAEGLNVLAASAENLASDIEFKQSALSAIEEDTAIKLRKAIAELELKVTENADDVLETLLAERDLAYISNNSVSDITDALASAQAVNEDAIEKAVNVASALLHSRYGGEKKTLEADHKVAVAEKDADIRSLTQQISFMQITLDNQAKTIAAEREARIAIAASEAGKQGVVVNTTSK